MLTRHAITGFIILFALPVFAGDITDTARLARYSRREAHFSDKANFTNLLDTSANAQMRYTGENKFLLTLSDQHAGHSVDAIGSHCLIKDLPITVTKVEDNGEYTSKRLFGTGRIDPQCTVTVVLDQTPSANIALMRTNIHANDPIGNGSYPEIHGCEKACPDIADSNQMMLEYRLSSTDKNLQEWMHEHTDAPAYWTDEKEPVIRPAPVHFSVPHNLSN